MGTQNPPSSSTDESGSKKCFVVHKRKGGGEKGRPPPSRSLRASATPGTGDTATTSSDDDEALSSLARSRARAIGLVHWNAVSMLPSKTRLTLDPDALPSGTTAVDGSVEAADDAVEAPFFPPDLSSLSLDDVGWGRCPFLPAFGSDRPGGTATSPIDDDADVVVAVLAHPVPQHSVRASDRPSLTSDLRTDRDDDDGGGVGPSW